MKESFRQTDIEYINTRRILFYLNTRNKRTCVDCGCSLSYLDNLPGNKRGRYQIVRCNECKEEYNRGRKREQDKKFRNKFKRKVIDINNCQLGTIPMKTKQHLIKDKDGKPDWEKELEEVRKLKEATFKYREIKEYDR